MAPDQPSGPDRQGGNEPLSSVTGRPQETGINGPLAPGSSTPSGSIVRRWWLLVAVSGLILLIAPLFGTRTLSWSALWSGDNSPDRILLVSIRLPRLGLGFLAGALLTLGGTICQVLFRNELATPYTLGVASTASLGAVVYMALGGPALVWGIPVIVLAAFAGALLGMGVVYGAARFSGNLTPGTLLLAGVAVSFAAASLLMFVQYLAHPHDLFRMMRHLMGSLAVADWQGTLFLGVTLAGSGVFVWIRSWELDLLRLGEDFAGTHGVAGAALRKTLFLLICLAEAMVVAWCGPIGFVGLMVPHMARSLLGPGHRWLIPGAALLGGSFLVLCDALARMVIRPAELPVGILTSMLGGPFFLWLLIRSGASGDR